MPTLCTLAPDNSPYWADNLDYDFRQAKYLVANNIYRKDITNNYVLTGNELNWVLYTANNPTISLPRGVGAGYSVGVRATEAGFFNLVPSDCILSGKVGTASVTAGWSYAWCTHLGNGVWEIWGELLDNALLTDLIGMYEFENSANLGLDSAGLNNLTNVNGVSQVPSGLLNLRQSGSFDEDSVQYLESTRLIDTTQSFYVSGWFKANPTETVSVANILTSQLLTGSNFEYSSYSTINAQHASGGDAIIVALFDSALSMLGVWIFPKSENQLTKWHFYEVGFNATTGERFLNFDRRGNPDVVLNGTVASNGDIVASTGFANVLPTALFRVGRGEGFIADGLLDQFYVRDGSIPDQTERDLLFGGIRFAQMG